MEPLVKSDIKQAVYKRLTRKMTNLVQNVPYKEDKTATLLTTTPAKLLRPKSSVTKQPHSGSYAVNKQK